MTEYMEIGGAEIESPIINGGGVVTSVKDVVDMCDTGIGAVEVGSICLLPREEKSGTVFYHDPLTGLTENDRGMPGQGANALSEELPTMLKVSCEAKKPLIVNIAPVSDDPEEEIFSILSTLDSNPLAHSIGAILLNAGCPNVLNSRGYRHDILSYHPSRMLDVLRVLNDYRYRSILFSDLWVRISPFRNRDEVGPIVEVCSEAEVDAISAFNSFPIQPGAPSHLDTSSATGGYSGKAMEARALEQTLWLTERMHIEGVKIAVVGAVGIHDGASVRRRRDVGASAVSLTSRFYEGRSFRETVDKIHLEYAES